MGRNKYPEETVWIILDTAERLFIQKGYEKTSLQDIIRETDLSKGAIYHHFTSKEEIFYSVCERIGQRNAEVLSSVRDDPSLNGLEKLRRIFKVSLQPERQAKMFSMMPYLLDNAKFLAMEMRSIFQEVVPIFMEPIIRQGIADGSIRTDHPEQLSEVLLILSDLWLHPILRPSTPEQVRARCAFFNQFTRQYGFELLDGDLIEAMAEFSRT